MKRVEHVEGSKGNVDVMFDVQDIVEHRWNIVGLEAHLKASILANFTGITGNCWFSSYLSSAGSNPNVARLTVCLRASRRIEDLPFDVRGLIDDVRHRYGDSIKKATHVIHQIVYGFNVIIVFDLVTSSMDDKIEAEERLFLQAKSLFEKLLAREKPSAIMDAQDTSLLESATRRIHSDIKIDPLEGASPFINWLGGLQRAVLSPSNSCWPAIKMVLFPVDYIAPKTPRDLPADSLASLSALKGILLQVKSKWQQLMDDPFLDRVPHFFAWLQEGFGPFLRHCTETLLGLIRTSVIDYRRSQIESDSIAGHLTHLADGALLEYVLARKRDLSILKSLLDGVNLKFKSLQELNAKFGDKKRPVVIFFLKTNQVRDRMLEALQKRFDLLNEPTKLWTCFEITSSGTSQQNLQSLRKLLLKFQKASQAKEDMPFFLSTSETYQDGFDVSWNGIAKGPASLPPSGEEKKKKTARPATPGTATRQENKVKREGSDESVPMEDEQSPKTVQDEEEPEPEEEDRVEIRDSTTYKDIYDKPCDNLRPAEKFARLSELLKKETPSIYLLKASERVTSNKELRWFDIGNPGGTSGAERKPHKVLILMGATGSGKSTLVNGMVNYILGVEWDDPFRFSIVKEENATTSNQAKSQTRGVTAYTIHHAKGMKIGHGLTIIDTPGYGDTGGIERDQEITRIIGRFLSHQQSQNSLISIHAVCFVASSADSRLTPTQQYVLESVVSLFGRDVTNSLRLLVTFSDGMKPPVLEAVIAAEIPGLSEKKDGSIQHHKFNNCALYATNLADSEDELCFDRGYWDLGQKNFHDFFAMLGKMPARSLQQTLAVIQSRTDLEHTLKDIEEQLKTSLEKIQEIERFRQQVARLGSKVEANKNFQVTEDHWVLEKVPSGRGKKAFNCSRCLTTCGVHYWSGLKKTSVAGYFGVKLCKNSLCFCLDDDHSLDDFRWEEHRTVRTRTLQDMKEEYEMSMGCKMSIEDMLKKREEELETVKQKGVALFKSLADCLRSLESSALRAKKHTVSDYVNLMKSRMEQEKRPGFGTRIKILEELEARATRDAHHSVYTMNNNNYRSAGRGTSGYSAMSIPSPHQTGRQITPNSYYYQHGYP